MCDKLPNGRYDIEEYFFIIKYADSSLNILYAAT